MFNCSKIKIINFLSFFSQKYLGFSKMDKKKCPKLKIPKKSWEKIAIVTINYFYRLVAKNIISKMLA
jgi:hypothetical protein